jgi:hypothetical protein
MPVPNAGARVTLPLIVEAVREVFEVEQRLEPIGSDGRG